MKCVNCGTEYEGKFCPECGTKTQEQTDFKQQNVNQPFEAGKKGRKKPKKPKKPIYKRWWFFVIVGIALIAIIGTATSGEKTEKIKWNEMVLGAQLPEPPVNKGKIHENSSETLYIEVKKSLTANMPIMLPLLRKKALQLMQNRPRILIRHIIPMATA